MIRTLNLKIFKLNSENEKFESKEKDFTQEIKDLENLNKKGRQASDKLSKEISRIKAKFEKEKETILKEHRIEIKFWKKELGEETKHRIKLEKKMKEREPLKAIMEKATGCFDEDLNKNLINSKSSETSSSSTSTTINTTECTICAEPIPNYKPTLFFGTKMNPACDLCKSPSLDTETCSENLQIKPSNLAEDNLEAKPEKKNVELDEKIRQKVKTKLEVKFLNGDISRAEMEKLEEELGQELRAELIAENEAT